MAYYFKNCDIVVLGDKLFIERVVDSNVEKVTLVYKDGHFIKVLEEEK